MILIWAYSLNTDKKGNFVKKPMPKCTGSEVCAEWLYHIGIPMDKIKEYAELLKAARPALDKFVEYATTGLDDLLVPDKEETE